MQKANQTAGETAGKTLVIFRDCHVSHNIDVPVGSASEERFVRNFASRMGWPCATRREKGGAR